MRPTRTPLRATRNGTPGLRFPSGRWYPIRIAGGADDPPPDPKPADPPADPPAPPAPDPKPADPPDPKPADPDDLGPAGKAALEAERTARREADKRARAAEARIAAAEKAQREADDRAKAEQGRYRELWEEQKQRADDLEVQLADRDAKAAEDVRKSQYLAAARRLQFKDPEAAYAILAYRGNTSSDDENVIEHELTKLRDEKVLPVDERKRTGADIVDPARNGEPDDVAAGRSRIRMARRAA